MFYKNASHDQYSSWVGAKIGKSKWHSMSFTFTVLKKYELISQLGILSSQNIRCLDDVKAVRNMKFFFTFVTNIKFKFALKLTRWQGKIKFQYRRAKRITNKTWFLNKNC